MEGRLSRRIEGVGEGSGERVGNEDVVGERGWLPRINPRCAQLQ